MSAGVQALRWLAGGIRLPLAAGAALLALYGGAMADAYGQQLLAIAGCYALMVLGYQFIFGHAGALSLAQGAFFGLGAYVAAILGAGFGWGFELTFPLAVLLPVALAAAIALPVLRLESHYLALATLGIGQVVLLVAVNWEAVTGGANGLPGVPAVELFGLAVGRGRPLLALIWFLVGLGALASWRITAGLAGRRLETMREDVVLARALGMNTGATRLAMLLLSAGYGGAAGALYAHTIGVVSPQSLAFPMMVAALTMAVVGGRLHVAGAVLGALLLVHLPEWSRQLEDWRLVVYGLAMLVAIIAAPDGIVGLLAQLRARLLPELPPPLPAPLALPSRAPPGVAATLLEVRDLGKRFGGVTAVDGVSLDIAAGDILGLIGANGSGKTTLANLITGVERADCGRVRLGGREITGLPVWEISRAGIARSFQTSRLPPAMPVLDAVAIACVGAPQDAAARGQAMALLARLGLAEAGAKPCDALGPGARRRLEIARALALAPRLLVLDEPAAGLDRRAREDLARLLRELAAEGIGLLVIEHDIDFLAPLASRMICLDRGRAIAAGPPAGLVDLAEVRAALMGAGTGQP